MKLILLLVLAVIVLPASFAVCDFSDDFSSAATSAIKWSLNNAVVENSLMNISSAANVQPVTMNFTFSNGSYEFKFKNKDGTGFNHNIYWQLDLGSTNKFQIGLRGDGIYTVWNTFVYSYSNATYIINVNSSVSDSNYDWHTVRFFRNTTNQWCIFFDGALLSCAASTDNSLFNNISKLSASSVYGDYYIDSFNVYSGSVNCFNETALVDVSINQSTYNVTSAEGIGTVWRNNLNHTVNTTDPTPTVTFMASDVVNCSIGTSNLNYTAMVANDSNTKCGTVNTNNMTCTLPSSKGLSYGNHYLYISCGGGGFAEYATSTSGGLNITLLPANVTEALARTRIDLAINNTLTQHTVYSDQQIYTRRKEGTQQLGTFDRVVVRGTQRWAINYLTGSEVYTTLTNMTPVLYVYESTNITMAQLQSEVETFLSTTVS